MAISSIPSDIFRKAEETDIERIWQIIGQAKAQMQRLGSQQWDENYPAIEHIRQDIQDGNGYVICREDRVVAYGVISFDGEPVYKDIEGKWSNDLPYVIVHRLAIADEMKRQGMAKQFMLQAEEVSQILWRSVLPEQQCKESFRKDNPPLLPPDRHFRLYDSGSNF